LCRLVDAFRVPWRELAILGVAFGGGFKLDPGPTRWGFRLRQKSDQSCVFAVGEMIRCGARAVAPAACRVYPFHVALRDDGVHVVMGNDAACPVEEAAAWSTLASPSGERIQRELDEFDRYQQMIERWESQLEQKHDAEAFLTFAQEWLP
jgi:hypothetical protein